MAGWGSACWIVIAMIALVEAVYLPPALFGGGRTLLGLDYQALHVQRIAFARQAVLTGHGVPAWYPYDFLGAPFTANLQSFPWTPPRLLLLLLDPEAAYPAGVALAAALAAGFTFLFCRRAGLSPLGAAAAGWTFACAGFFSSRVAAGHLPLLEAYAALPLLLWAADRALVSRRRRDLLLLTLSAAGFAVAGHPQLPAYALAATALYVLWRGRGMARVRVVSVLASGVGATLIAWWPMLLLIQRSSRILPLAPADNDIAMPYGRLLALLVPGTDGWPDILPAAGAKLFDGYPSYAYFLGYRLLPGPGAAGRRPLPGPALPDRATPACPAVDVSRRPGPRRARPFPPADAACPRAAARHLAAQPRPLALPLHLRRLGRARSRRGRGSLRRPAPPCAPMGIVGACLALHAFDLGGFARHFILAVPRPAASAPELDRFLARELGDAWPLDRDLDLPLPGRYQTSAASNPFCWPATTAPCSPHGRPCRPQRTSIDASSLPLRALQATGARFVVASQPRDDLPAAGELDGAHVYRVPSRLPGPSFSPRPARCATRGLPATRSPSKPTAPTTATCA